MPSYLFDTSALVKLYHPEAGTTRIEAIFRETANRFFVSKLTVVEIESAFAMKQKTGAISSEQRRLATARFYADLASSLTVISMTDVHFNLARLLVKRYGSLGGLRTLDALQLAVASELRRVHMVEFFVSADAKLAEVADTQGIQVINPVKN